MEARTTLLWPHELTLDNCIDDFVYGWTQPLYCAAGVLSAESIEEAQALLQSARTPQEWDALKQHCQSYPVVFGRVQDRLGSGEVAVTLLQDYRRRPALIQYRRPSLRHMEIYALDFRLYNNDLLSSRSDGRVHDFTAPSITSCSLGPSVLEQINFGTHLDHQLRELRARPRRMHAESLVSSALPYLSGWQVFNFTAPYIVVSVLRFLAGARNIVNKISACCHQVDVRLRQSIMLPRQIPRLYRSTVPSTSRYISFYVHFWNTVWLVLNDVTIGVAIGTFVCENASPLASLLGPPMKASLIHLPQEALLWLNNWPAGLKLNTELSQFYCHSLLGVIVVWSRVLETVLFPSLPQLLYIAGALGTCGMTMTVSMLSDLLSCFTFHLFICYRASALIYSYQLSIAASLWNLFRGKRYNILRSRKDAWDYDVDQLLLGAILSTLVAFLSPTVFTYYAFFATARFLVVVVHAVFDTILVLMNHFPLFALLLRTKSPLRMPGGLVYKLHKNNSPPTVEIQPIAFARIFDHYGSLGSRMWSHYHPLRLFRMILRGEPLTTIPRTLVQFPIMSDTGVSVA